MEKNVFFKKKTKHQILTSFKACSKKEKAQKIIMKII